MFRKLLLGLLLPVLMAVGLGVAIPSTAQAAQPTWLCGRSSPQSVSAVIFKWQFDTFYDQSVPVGWVYGEGACGVYTTDKALSLNGYPAGFLLGGGGCARHRYGVAIPATRTKQTNSLPQSQISWSASVHTVGPFASTTFQDFRVHPDYASFYDGVDHGAIVFDVRKYAPTNGHC